MNMNRIIHHLEKLCAIDTQNPPRAIEAGSEIFSYLASVVGEAFETRVWDHGDGHVTCLLQRGAPRILFNVHLDTVPAGEGWGSDPFRLTIRGVRAHARGACDIKGAAACLLAIAEQRPDHMAMLFTTDEEGAGGCCVRRYLESEPVSHFQQVVVAEPTACRAILGHRGFVSFKIWFDGEAGHSSEARALGDSAIHRYSRWSADALALAESRKQSADDPGTCFNIGLVEGGTKSNVIAGQVFAHASFRLAPGDSNQAFIDELVSLGACGDSMHWEVPFMGEPLPAAGQDSDQASKFAMAMRLDVGPPVDFWTEASIFSEFGLSAVVLGPGHIEQAHAVNEWVSTHQLATAYEQYQRIIKNDEGGRQ